MIDTAEKCLHKLKYKLKFYQIDPVTFEDQIDDVEHAIKETEKKIENSHSSESPF